MGQIVDTIRQFLDEAEFTYEFEEEVPCFDFGLNVENGTVQVRIIGRDDDDFMLIYVVWDGKVPQRSVPLIVPLLNDINLSTRFTTLCVDPKDGELSCHCGINTDQSAISVQQVGVSLQVAVRALDDNIDKIMRLAWSAPANSDGKYN